MRNYLLLMLAIGLSGFVSAQTVVFTDDFESGLGAWTVSGGYGTATQFANSGVNSLTESPVGLYPNNLNASAELTTGLDFSTALDADLTFWSVYDIEQGFDFGYVDVSDNGGTSWVNIATFNGNNQLTPWVQYTYSLGGVVGNNNVKIRFRFESDGGLQLEGWFIDDVEITTYATDNSPPLIIHTESEQYEGDIDSVSLAADFLDISGISVAELKYEVDNGPTQTITASDTTNDTYTFVVPTQQPGAFVKYWLEGTDNSTNLNNVVSDTFNYISGRYIAYDNGIVDFINSFGPSGISGQDGAAVRISLTGSSGVTQLVSALIRNYTDVNNQNDSMMFHVWEDDNGEPGANLISPFLVAPEATLQFPNQTTRIDLRPYASQLSNLSGDVFIGFTVPATSTPNGEVFVVQSTPGNANRTFQWDGTNWNSITDDYHFRAITSEILAPPVAAFTADNTNDPTIDFTDQSTNSPNVWSWDFDDGSPLDSTQNPSHTYATVGTYNVCLTAGNIAGLNTVCQSVTITNTAPNADFGFSGANDPQYDFVDFSSQNPTTWLWDFDDNGATSSLQNPSHTFSDSGSYNVCLTASNPFGSDTECKTVNVANALPVANFGANVSLFNNLVTFTDSSTNTPTSWSWDFGYNNETSTDQNPMHTFPNSGGMYTVCLVATNIAGSSDPFCVDLDLTDYTIGVDELVAKEAIKVFPNPVLHMATLNLSDEVANEAVQIRLFSTLGQEVPLRITRSGNQVTLFRDNLPSGVYYLQVQANDKQVSNGKVIFE